MNNNNKKYPWNKSRKLQKNQCINFKKICRNATLTFKFFYFRHSGQRDYKCAACGFFGYTYTDIRKHIERRHSVSCPQCKQVFADSELLKVNLKYFKANFLSNFNFESGYDTKS